MVPPGIALRLVNQVGRVKVVDFRSQACADWIGFTVVTNLALTASGVGMGSYPDSPGGLIYNTFTSSFYTNIT